jgi:hypothetical protein
MVIKNLSTGKNYEVTKDEYETHFKGKLNWKVVSEETTIEQKIDNTLTRIIEEKPKKQTQTKKSKTNE